MGKPMAEKLPPLRRRATNSHGSSNDILRSLVEHAIRAPSAHNTQPWLFRIDKFRLTLCADRTRALPVVDPFDRALVISCGAALGHMKVAARHYGHSLAVRSFADPADEDVLAVVELGDPVSPSTVDEAMFDAIERRVTTRSRFDERLLPVALLRQCESLSRRFDVQLSLYSDPARRAALGWLVAEGDRIQFSEPRFRRELATWIHSRRSPSHDGMSGESFGMPDRLSAVGAAVIRTFDIGEGVAASDGEKIATGSPTLALFSTPTDFAADWLATGQALSHVLLALTAQGVSASFLNQPIEVDALRSQLARTSGIDGVPQLLMRLGYGATGKPSVRRPVESVLLPPSG